MTDPQGYRIEAFEPASLSAEQLRDAALLQQALMRERVPEDPLLSVEALEARIRVVPQGQWRAYFAARDERGAVAGYGVIGRELNEPGNQHLRWCELAVHAAHRRRGVGRALLRRMVEAVAGQGEDLVLMGMANDRVPSGAAFARAMGATPGLDMKTNQLDLLKVDRAKVDEWAALAPAGYRLERIDGALPADLVPPYIQAARGMNDAPRGDLRMDDWHLTEEQIRDRESYLRQAGVEEWLLLAVHETTREGAGFTAVTYDPKVPHLIWQQGTAVLPAHRGHRIGLWMKATMLRRILDERPQARFIRTGNANANAQMLGINTQLGFVQAWAACIWQLPIAAARAATGLEPAATASTR